MKRSIKLAGLVASLSVASVTKPAPSTTSSRPPGTPAATTPSGPVKLALDLTRLKEGATPATSYADGRTLNPWILTGCPWNCFTRSYVVMPALAGQVLWIAVPPTGRRADDARC
ncbi:MAG: hypothetical protein QOH84_5117 [Kribbellaceae bacterium]|nr:hypothetical protein [Kribbellaceae bacterium]